MKIKLYKNKKKIEHWKQKEKEKRKNKENLENVTLIVKNLRGFSTVCVHCIQEC